MSLLRVTVRPPALLRHASSKSTPTNARIQLTKPTGETGFFNYARNWSRDPQLAKKFAPPQKGDLPLSFLFRRLGHAYEVYPLFVLTAWWFFIFCYACYFSFNKIEIWFDRTNSTAPWDWSRIRDTYWKKSTLVFDLDGRTRKRCELMEMLQDEILEAAKKRGTR